MGMAARRSVALGSGDCAAARANGQAKRRRGKSRKNRLARRSGNKRLARSAIGAKIAENSTSGKRTFLRAAFLRKKIAMKFDPCPPRWTPTARRKGELRRVADANWREHQEREAPSSLEYESWMLAAIGLIDDPWAEEVGLPSPKIQGRGEPLELFAPREGKWPPFLLSFSLFDHSVQSWRHWAGLASSRAMPAAVATVCQGDGALDRSKGDASAPAGFEALSALKIQGAEPFAAQEAPGASVASLARKASPLMAMLALDRLSDALGEAAEKRLAALGFERGGPSPAVSGRAPDPQWPHRSLWMPFLGDVSKSAPGRGAEEWGVACKEAAQEILGPLARWASFDRSQPASQGSSWAADSARALFGDPAAKKERRSLLRAVQAGQAARAQAAAANGAAGDTMSLQSEESNAMKNGSFASGRRRRL